VGVGVAFAAGWELAEVEEEPLPPHEVISKDKVRIAVHVGTACQILIRTSNQKLFF
jgi:hypothetical protein